MTDPFAAYDLPASWQATRMARFEQRAGRSSMPLSPIMAVSGDARFLTLVSHDRFVARVHSVFEKVVNLSRVQDQALFTLATRGLDDAPNTIVVAEASTAPFGVRPDVLVSARGGRLQIDGRCEVTLHAVRPWRARLPRFTPLVEAGPRAMAGVSDAIDCVIEVEGICGGIVPDPHARSDVDRALTRMLTAETGGLVLALARQDLPSAHQHGSRLIGLGPGLTPSGDDYIVGLALVSAMAGGLVGRYQPFLAGLIREHRSRTNEISFTAMREATRGRARQSLIALFDAAVTDDRHALRDAAQGVIAIGNTSGTDILSGVQAGLHLELELRGWT